MARKKMTPADVVIAEFGIRPLARELNIDPTTIVRWRRSARGLVPSAYHTALLDLAVREKVTLTAEDLVNGRVS